MAWYGSWIGDLDKVGQRSWPERWLLVEALVGVSVAGVLVRTIPFKLLAGWCGLRPGEGPAEGPPVLLQKEADRVGWAVGMGHNSPRQSRTRSGFTSVAIRNPPSHKIRVERSTFAMR
ncbi:MAG: hypothetical protein HYX94_09310 [Chloroflexi bacterium]|nr:hypothetical protein [Chloroflexota bacterium]